MSSAVALIILGVAPFLIVIFGERRPKGGRERHEQENYSRLVIGADRPASFLKGYAWGAATMFGAAYRSPLLR